MLPGTYKYSEHIGYAATGAEVIFNVELNIINDHEMTITSNDTLNIIEITKGTYTVEGNLLTYTRIYSGDGNDEWQKCNKTEKETAWIDCNWFKPLKTENFIINKDSKTLYSTNFGGMAESFIGYGPITLKYQENN